MVGGFLCSFSVAEVFSFSLPSLFFLKQKKHPKWSVSTSFERDDLATVSHYLLSFCLSKEKTVHPTAYSAPARGGEMISPPIMEWVIVCTVNKKAIPVADGLAGPVP